jgi:hypothetical protein
MGRHPDGRLVSRLSDEELEYYGDLYGSQSIRAAGIEFEKFLSNPEYYLAKYGKPMLSRRARPASWWKSLKRALGVRSAEEPA